MAILVQQSESTAAYRRLFFHCVDVVDGLTPETGEAGGQPQISLNGGAWGNTTNTLVAIGNGRYYVELVAATEVNSLGIIEGRYKSANTAEALGTTLQVVPYDPYDANRGSSLVLGAGDVGDFKKNGVVHFLWNTIDGSGAAIAPTTAGTIRVYKDDGTGEVTVPTGITDTRAFDTVVGLHECKIDLSVNSFYEKEKNYFAVVVGAVIDTKTVNAIIASFSIENRWANVHFEYGG